jgi:uncharacterized protein (TIGR00369 family)
MSDPTMSAERAEALAQFTEEGIPFNKALGIKVVTLRPGYCVLRIPWKDELTGDPFRPAVHGGVTAALVDTAGGMACYSALTSHRDRASTVDLRVDYLAPGPARDMVCEARVVRMGNKVAVAQMSVWPDEVPEPGSEAHGKPFATGHGVYNIVRRSGPQGGPTSG